ncbi:MAG: N-acetylmuramoyl-L-alanine amidase [Alphaproteobacteria bacterium]|nr:N-acetylmuramoyl-L-alanine amidase [Alphaproteobacteria bacterium]
MEILERPSPNHDARPPGTSVDILLLHYTGMESAEAALARMCDPTAKVSAHYCIEEDGRIARLVPEDRRAWHAGASCWAGAEDINARSIGIELVNPGHEFGYRAFPEAQMTALIALARDILARYPIPPRRVLGHSDVAPLRKEDPGELFDWARLAGAGIGLWPQELASPAGVKAEAAAEREVRTGLARFGYGYLEDDFAAVVTAFQRHFRPGAVTGEADGETAVVLRALLNLVD